VIEKAFGLGGVKFRFSFPSTLSGWFFDRVSHWRLSAICLLLSSFNRQHPGVADLHDVVYTNGEYRWQSRVTPNLFFGAKTNSYSMSWIVASKSSHFLLPELKLKKIEHYSPYHAVWQVHPLWPMYQCCLQQVGVKKIGRSTPNFCVCCVFLANGEELEPRSVRHVLLRFAAMESVSRFECYNIDTYVWHCFLTFCTIFGLKRCDCN
jgi:hypothetical protein